MTGRTEIPFPLDKFVVPTTALLYPAFKNKVRVKYDISNSLNQLQFSFSSDFDFDLPLTVSNNCACNATQHVVEKGCVYQATIV